MQNVLVVAQVPVLHESSTCSKLLLCSRTSSSSVPLQRNGTPPAPSYSMTERFLDNFYNGFTCLSSFLS